MALIRPDRYLHSVLDIDPVADLAQAGVRVVFLDMDNTLRPRDTKVVPEDVRAWLQAVKDAGVRPCVLSNSFQPATQTDSEALGLPVVMKAMKPLPFAYFKALSAMGVKRKECVCVGDQLSTDIWGANLFGIKSVLVEPQCDLDLGHTARIRKIEALFLKGVKPE